MEDSYRSLEKSAEGLFRDRSSRFLAFGFPVKTTLEINDIVSGIRKKHHDARHHCYAYRLGLNKNIFRINDDGEPSGTAGKPIYGQLLSYDLTDTLVMVVRYFGGTLLGTSGLINAYKSATIDMLSRATIITKFVENNYHISFPFEKLSAVMKVLKEENIVPTQLEYDAQCIINIAIRRSLADRIIARLSGVYGLITETVQMND